MPQALGGLHPGQAYADVTGAEGMMHLPVAQLEEIGAVADPVASQSGCAQKGIFIGDGEG
jgi:hypothetical protein